MNESELANPSRKTKRYECRQRRTRGHNRGKYSDSSHMKASEAEICFYPPDERNGSRYCSNCRF
jgi:hypothetical protein